jgi:Predicted membrane protein
LKLFREYTTVYFIGNLAYTLIEILWRGYTHWTMAVVGGVCFLCYYIFNAKVKRLHIVKRSLGGCGIFTTLEFIVGCVVNKILHWNVWDYSNLAGNILGQICVFYSLMWFLLCLPVTVLCRLIKNNVFTNS